MRFPPSITRAFSQETAGGSLLDIGVYPLYLAAAIFSGPPLRVQAMAKLTAAGVDESLSFTLQWLGGEMAQCFSSIALDGPREVHVIGEKGRVHVHDVDCDRSWYGSTRMTVLRKREDGSGSDEEHLTFPLLSEGDGQWNGRHRVLLAYEAQEVHRCLHEGLTQSPSMPWEETRVLHMTMDLIRKEVGVHYATDGA